MSTESPSWVKQPIDTVKHVFVLHKLAPVGLFDAFLHPGDEAGLIFEHTGNSVFNQLLGILAMGKGQLLEPRFNVGRKMYFHTPQDTRKPEMKQHGKRKHVQLVAGSAEVGVLGPPPRHYIGK